MRFVNANNVCLHHCNSLDYLLQQLIPFSLPLFSQPLLFFGLSLPFCGLSLLLCGLSLPFFGLSLPFFGLSLPFFGLSLPFFGLSLSFIHSVHVFIQYPGHCRGQLRHAFQSADSVFHLCLRSQSPCGFDCITPMGSRQPLVWYSQAVIQRQQGRDR
jgi:hypothetical protein